jgi:glyoxylase-like metal-dependent hydrolase (beta-lactamase superfamily II)
MTSPFVEIADRCFVARYRQWDVSVGLVVGSDGAMVIDTRASSQQGKEIVRDVRALGLDVPVRTVANTHVHFDHSFGNGSFPAARVIAHDAVGRRWRDDEERIKALFRADPGDGPECGYTAADVAGILATTVRGPDDTFDRATTVELGDREVRLVHAGRGHTDGDIAIRVPDAGVTFLGDLIEQSATPALGGDSYPLEWAPTLEQITGELAPAEVVVPGHGQRVDRAFVERQTLDIAAIAGVIRDLWAAGVPEREAAESGTGRWPWPTEALGHAVARGYAHLAEGQKRLSSSPSG